MNELDQDEQFYRDTESKNPASSFRHLTTQPCAALFRAVYSRTALLGTRSTGSLQPDRILVNFALCREILRSK